MTSHHYRADIDGLRALAVIPVILFHAEVAGFSGGYIGVDVFFVISGYLITSIIAKEIEERSFTFIGFWERRARRILPAVTTVLIASLIAGWFILLPWDYRHLGQEVVAQSGFVSNVFFWLRSDYFAPEAEFRTLLHTWSLSVEEQFYLLYPAILLLVTTRAPRHRLALLVALAVLSFAGALYWMRFEPSAAFYFLPARAWELLIGVVLALAAIEAPKRKGVREILAWTGIVLVLLPVWLYDDQTSFPGVTALVPCLGTALLIYANAAENSLSRLLSSGPLVTIGLLSYSLYLWHWPVIVFLKYLNPGPLSPAHAAVIVAVTAVLSVLCYRFIETPIRRRRLLQSRTALFSALAIPICAVAALGYLAHASGGFPARWPPEIRLFADGLGDINPKRGQCIGPTASQVLQNDLCHLGTMEPAQDGPLLLVWGDSHADALMPAIDAMVDSRGLRGRQIVKDACLPLISEHVRLTRVCQELHRAVMTWIEREKPDIIFIIGRWDTLIERRVNPFPGNGPPLLQAFEETFANLKVPYGRTVIFRQAPLQYGEVPRLLVNAAMQHQDVHAVGKRLDEHRRERLGESEVFTALERMGVRTIDPAVALCDAERCSASVGPYSAYYDDNHLSARGAMRLLPLIDFQAMTLIRGIQFETHETAPVRVEPVNRVKADAAHDASETAGRRD